MNNIIDSCNWDTARFLMFSQNVFDPIIYYSHIGPFILAFILGLFAYFGDRKSLSNKILITLVFIFCIWDAIDLILWANEKIEYVMFFWSSMIFFDLLIYAISFYLAYVFINKKDLSIFKKIVAGLVFIPLVVFVSTKHNLAFFDLTNCDREAPEGILWSYTYIVEILFIVWILVEGIIVLIKNKESREKNALFLVGIILFLVTFSWGNISGMLTEDWSIGQYGLFGVPVFAGFLTYLIVKFKVINAKLIGAQALVLTMTFFVGALLLIQDPYTIRIMIWITLILSLLFGYMLILSVRKENERRQELQIMADRLASANDQLRKLDNAKTEFISIASHQLRTPLTSVKGFVSMIIEGSYGDISPAVKDALVKVYSSSERLIQLVEDLLNVSRIESGRLQFVFEKADFGKVMQEIYDNFILVAKNKKMYLDLKMPDKKIPEITMDSGKIREVVSNLVDNAFKYTEKGGVTMKAEMIGDDTVRIMVSDTGIGVPKEEVQNLFKKFSRGKDTSRLHASGTGLGLYVGKEIINAHNGKIWLESEGEGKGTKFFVELPITHQDV